MQMLVRLLRPLTIAIGLSLMMVGSGLMFVDRLVFKTSEDMRAARMPAVLIRSAPAVRQEFGVPAWMPFTMVAAGGLTVLYSLALPRPDQT
jgi:hypothetical protein